MTIEKIVSPSGIQAWLVREHAVPLVALNYAFHGGSSQDDADKAGTASLAANLLDEGAGSLDSKTYHERLEDHAIELGFHVGRDYFRGSLRTLNEHRDEAFDLLHLALTEPRFDAEAVERVRGQVLSRCAATPPTRTISPAAAGGRPRFPTTPTAARATARWKRCRASPPTTCATMSSRVFARNELTISIVGDIDADTAGKLIDRAFAALPANNNLKPVAADDRRKGSAGASSSDRRAAGGGQFRRPGHRPQRSRFHGRLYRQSHPRRRQLLLAALRGSARKARARLRRVGQPGLVPPRRRGARRHRHPRRPHRRRAKVIEHETKRMAENGPTADELAAAKSYIKGSYALSLDTSSKIAAQLTQIQIDNLGIDYIQRRGALIDAVGIDDAKRVAKRLYGGGMLVTVAGRPKGLTSSGE